MKTRTISFERLCVIKTGWSDTYQGGDPTGNFAWLTEGGAGAERFNMVRMNGGYQVWSAKIRDNMPKPAPLDGWTIVHVARDPARKTEAMRIIGWYEAAKFLPTYNDRSDEAASKFNIQAERALLLREADRPAIKHGNQFGSGNVFWLAGNHATESPTDWSKVRRRIIAAVEKAQGKAIMGGSLSAEKLSDWRGSTRKPLAKTIGLQTDDGGDVYGRSGGESDEHCSLRKWAMAHPELFLSADKIGSYTEYPLLSGDSVDAAHVTDDEIVLIEAKSWRSGENDKMRGIYQCIKYRAVQIAQLRDLSPKTRVRVVLLTEENLTERLQMLAKRHQIELMTKPVDQA